MAKGTDITAYSNREEITGGERIPTTKRAALTSHIPVRFPQSVIDQVEVLTQKDGVSVSTWIRRLVTEEVERRIPSWTSAVYDSTWRP